MGREFIAAIAEAVPAEAVLADLIEFASTMLIPTILILGTAVFICHLVVSRLTRPLRDATTTVGSLARRDYQADIASSDAQGDIGELTRACIALRTNLLVGALLAEAVAAQQEEMSRRGAEMARVVKDLQAGPARLAAGDLTSPIASPPDAPFPPENDPLRQSYNAVVERVSYMIDQVSLIARCVHDSAAEITDVSRELSGRAETHAAPTKRPDGCQTSPWPPPNRRGDWLK